MKWTKKRVVRAIRSRHRQGLSLATVYRDDRPLCVAAASRFGTWRAAMQAAGFSCARRQWSRELVLAEITSRHRQGQPLSGVQSKDRFLFAAAWRYFGGWRKALAAAGLSAQRPRKWTHQSVIAAIQARQEQGPPSTATRKEYIALRTAAVRLFGTWREALRAANVDAALPHQWTANDVLVEIHKRQSEGLRLTRIWEESPPLYRAAKRLFGGWCLALCAAGLSAQIRVRWDKERVIAAIQAYHRSGFPVSEIWRKDKPLFRAGCRRFGNWQNALAAAGLPARQYRKWSQEAVLEGLRAWRHIPPRDLRKHDSALAGAAAHLFGTLTAALEAAGMEPDPRRWTPARVIAAIQDRYVRGLPIQRVGFGDVRLGTAAKRRFGSWADAVAAAGLGSRLPEAKPVRRWTKEAVLEAIRQGHEQGKGTKSLWKRDTGLYTAAKKHFGTWTQAVVAAGLQPSRRRWTPERVVEEIRSWHRRGVPVRSISRQDPCLTTAAIRLYGNWRRALEAAELVASATAADRSRTRLRFPSS